MTVALHVIIDSFFSVIFSVLETWHPNLDHSQMCLSLPRSSLHGDVLQARHTDVSQMGSCHLCPTPESPAFVNDDTISSLLI